MTEPRFKFPWSLTWPAREHRDGFEQAPPMPNGGDAGGAQELTIAGKVNHFGLAYIGSTIPRTELSGTRPRG